MNEKYDASCIEILDVEDVRARWFWAKAGELATRFNRPESWIRRGLTACEAAGVPHDYFVDRYLKRLSVPRDMTVDAAYRELHLSKRVW